MKCQFFAVVNIARQHQIPAKKPDFSGLRTVEHEGTYVTKHANTLILILQLKFDYPSQVYLIYLQKRFNSNYIIKSQVPRRSKFGNVLGLRDLVVSISAKGTRRVRNSRIICS